MVVSRKVACGLAAAAVAMGMLAGCDEGNASGDDSRTPTSGPSSSSMAPMGGQGDAASGAATEVQGDIDELLEANPISFAQQKAELSDESKTTLKAIAEGAKAADGVKLSVTTRSAFDNPDKALQLSQERGDAIKHELVANGMSGDAVETEALGNERSSTGGYAVAITAV
ncbi:MAG: OmpA family protein [Thermocrispum sp.]